MGSRLLPVVIAAAIALTPFVSTASATSAADPLPSSYVALGDSLTSAWGSGVSDGANVPGDNLPSSWATGSDPVVNSQMLRLEHAGATVSSVVNLAVPGTKVGSANGLVTQADSVPADAGLVLIEAGSSDVCADTSLTPTDAFQTSVEHALTTITQRAPDAKSSSHRSRTGTSSGKTSRRSRAVTRARFFSAPIRPCGNGCKPAGGEAGDDRLQQRARSACANFAACKYDGGLSTACISPSTTSLRSTASIPRGAARRKSQLRLRSRMVRFGTGAPLEAVRMTRRPARPPARQGSRSSLAHSSRCPMRHRS